MHQEAGDTPGIEYIDGLLGYAIVLTRYRPDAEDLIHDTYVRALDAYGSLREQQSLKSWLFTILRNLWLNQLRDSKRRPQGVEVEAADMKGELRSGPSDDPFEAYVRAQERKNVSEALAKLSHEYKEIILLREYEGLSYQELASILARPVGTVMSRLSRARATLRALLPQTPDPMSHQHGRNEE